MKMFLFAIGAPDRASSRLRVWDHLDWLEGRGVKVIADSLLPRAAQATRGAILRRLVARLPRWTAAFFRSDVVVVQESLLLWPLLLFKNLGKRRTVAFDFSDPVDRHGHGLKGALRQFAFARMVRRADVVSVENRGYCAALAGKAKALAHFYGPVNAARYRAGRSAPGDAGAPVRVGWTGSPGTYAFIAPLMPILDRIARDRPIEVVLMGVDRIDHHFEHARLTLLPWSEAEEFVRVPTWDLGLFRLQPTPDALWRGAGKLFIYMAAGVPFVATDAGIARATMGESKVGYPVPTDADWETVLRSAIDDCQGRSMMSARSIEFGTQNLSYEAYRSRILAPLTEGTGHGR